MSNIKDSFTYSVADQGLRGHLVKGLHMEDSYFDSKVTPDEFALLLSCNSSYYPVSLESFHETSIQDISASEVFPASGEFSSLFDSAVYSMSRTRCDICSMETNRVHKINYESSENILSSMNEPSSNVRISYENKSSHEMGSFYHCHYCMKDIHSEICDYIERSGRAVVVGNKI